MSPVEGSVDVRTVEAGSRYKGLEEQRPWEGPMSEVGWCGCWFTSGSIDILQRQIQSQSPLSVLASEAH
jgi:hypothetical protein